MGSLAPATVGDKILGSYHSPLGAWNSQNILDCKYGWKNCKSRYQKSSVLIGEQGREEAALRLWNSICKVHTKKCKQICKSKPTKPLSAPRDGVKRECHLGPEEMHGGSVQMDTWDLCASFCPCCKDGKRALTGKSSLGYLAILPSTSPKDGSLCKENTFLKSPRKSKALKLFTTGIKNVF